MEHSVWDLLFCFCFSKRAKPRDYRTQWYWCLSEDVPQLEIKLIGVLVSIKQFVILQY